MFRLLAVQLHDYGCKVKRVKLQALLAVVCICWCWPVLAQEAPANLPLESQAPSIHIVFDGQCTEAGTCRVLLKNVSSHAATDFLSSIVPTETVPVKDNAVNGPIPAGGTFSFEASEQYGLLIQAVIFDDGSYEGDRKQATYMAATRVGRWTQWERNRQRIDEIMAMDASDDYKLAMLREEVPKVPEDFELASHRFRKSYPTLSMSDPSTVDWLKGAMVSEKKVFIDTLGQHVKFLEQHPSREETLAQWWAKVEQVASDADPYNSAKK
ncbi:MAG: hypothetical protein ACHP7J_05110 [Terriglobales bacterium]